MSVYIYLFVFILIVGYASFYKGTCKKRIIIFLFWSFIALAFVQCMRDICIGEDTVNYVAWFADYIQEGWKNSILTPTRDVEIGYRITNLIIGSFTTRPQILLIVISLCILTLHFFFLGKNSKNIFITIILFFGMNHFLTSMSAWRQYLAMGIVFWLLPALLRGKYKSAVIILLLAFSFHKTSIVFGITVIGIFLVSRNVRNIWWILFLEMVSIPIVKVEFDIILEFLPKYKIYFALPGEHAMGLGEVRMLYILLELILLVYITVKKKYHTREMISMAILLVFSIYIAILNIFIPHIFRMGYYYDYYLLLVIPAVLPENPRNRSIIQLGIVIISFLFFCYYLLTNAGATVPYQMFI